MGKGFQWSIVLDSLELMLQGAGIAIGVALAAMLLAVVLGALVAGLRLSRFWFLRGPAFVYIQFFRGTSLFVFILWLFFGLTIVTGIRLGPFVAAVIALGVLNSAYMAEIYRSGLSAVRPGQYEAARALGLTSWHMYFDVIFPQTVPVIIPSAMNLFTDLLKDSALVGVIGVADLMRVTQRLANFHFRPLEFYTAAAAIYALIILFVSRVLAVRVERYYRRSQARSV
ncbi:MAG: nickel transporter [Anaerolineae bacterium]|nr:amino acid ABC transporter permease [Anaerolineales bacterium]MCQ3976274.1 nickel transporter [Anaerolineae bacterium]